MSNRIQGRYYKKDYIQTEDFIREGSFSAVTYVEFIFTQGMLNKYSAIVLLVTDLLGSYIGLGSLYSRTSTNFGLSYDAGGTDYDSAYQYVAHASPFSFGTGGNTGSNGIYSGDIEDNAKSVTEIYIHNPGSAAYTLISWEHYDIWGLTHGGGQRKTAQVTNAFLIFPTLGNITGRYVLTGIPIHA